MLVTICLPNDQEFEFDANMYFQAGDPGNLNGLPENCWPPTADECEFADYGPFTCMFDAVYTACWVHECPMSEEDMLKLANQVEERCCEEYVPEPYEPDFDTEDDICDWE